MSLRDAENGASAQKELDLDHLSQDKQLKLAPATIHEQGFWANGKLYLSSWQASKDFGVSKSTLCDRFHGAKDQRETHLAQQILSLAEEEVLVAWIKEKGQHAVPLQPRGVAECAEAIAGTEVGENWVH